MSKFRRPSLLAGGVLATAAVLVFAACGNGGGTTEVELSEFAVSASPASLSAGEITLNTANAGDFPHQLVVVRTDLAPGALPRRLVRTIVEGRGLKS